MSEPADEDRMARIVRFGVLHADMWAIDNQPWYGSQAEYTRRLIGTVVRHLGEVGLLVMPDDIDERLSHPIAMGPVPSTWPEAAGGTASPHRQIRSLAAPRAESGTRSR